LGEPASDAFNKVALRIAELEMVTLIVALEDEFGIKISDNQAKGLVTVADVIQLVRVLTQAKAAEELQLSSAAA
jgi:acyl carrier protein